MSDSSNSAPTAAPTTTSATSATTQIAVNAPNPITATSLRQIAVGLYGQRPDSMHPIWRIGDPTARAPGGAMLGGVPLWLVCSTV